MTATDILAMLRRHYLPEGRPPGGIFAPEIGSPCGKRRADLIWMPTTTGRGGAGLVGHEIKVTRSDVLTELADPTKADPWAQYCQRWFLVVADPAMVDRLDIPERWGILAPPSGRRTRTMTTLRPAPVLTPLEPAPGVTRVAAWLMFRDHDRIASLDSENRRLRGDLDAARQRATELATNGGGRRLSPREEQIRTVVLEAERLVRGTGTFILDRELDARDVAAAVCDAARLRAATHTAAMDLQNRLRDFQRALDPSRHLAGDLAAIVRDVEAAQSAAVAPVDVPA